VEVFECLFDLELPIKDSIDFWQPVGVRKEEMNWLKVGLVNELDKG
jgi:hypothetical protein